MRKAKRTTQSTSREQHKEGIKQRLKGAASEQAQLAPLEGGHETAPGLEWGEDQSQPCSLGNSPALTRPPFAHLRNETELHSPPDPANPEAP